MNEIIQFFSQTTFNWNVVECVAVFFSILYVILAAKESILCWWAAAISVTLYVYIYFSVQLYAETGLQVFYLFMAFYGYYNWNKKEQALQISEWNISSHFAVLILGTILTFLMGFYFTTYTNAKMPIVDSFTTVFSVFATYMVAKKILGNWLYWIVIDTVSIYLFYSRDLHLTSLLFMAYTIIAIFGYFSWIKKMRIDA
jgi:nicotinamide mononucleotide transporter